MLEKSRAIFLDSVKFSETSLITSFYTENFGRQSFIINSVRNKKSKVKASIFQPLYLLDLEFYYNPSKEIHRLKEVRISYPYNSIPFDIRKSSQAIFISELLNKCLREEASNPEMFDFIYHSLIFLDIAETGYSSFHIWFLLKLTHFLGIYPIYDKALINNYFDLQKAQFVLREPSHVHFVNKEITQLLIRLFEVDDLSKNNLNFTQNEKSILLSAIIEFYKIHFNHLGEVKSLAVLKEVFS